MQSTPSLLLFTALVFGVEYTLKHFFETQQPSRKSPLTMYIGYRGCHFLVLLAMGSFLFTNISPLRLFIFASLTSLLGSFELITSLAENLLACFFGLKCRWINTFSWVPMILLCITWSTRVQFNYLPPEGSLGVPELFLFVLLSHPANYLIRWLLARPQDPSLPDLVCTPWVLKIAENSRLAVAEITTTVDGSTDQYSDTLKAGRTIGILERWILLLFMVYGHLTAIGFLIAAKSIVRYQKLNDPDFAEYYLLGTLYSILVTLGAWVIFQGGAL